MPASLVSSAVNYGSTSYYDEGLLQVYQDYKSYLINHPSTRTIVVDEGLLYRNEVDVYGLMFELQIPPIYSWVVLMMNDLHNGLPLPRTSITMKIPNYDELEKIRSAYDSSKKIT